MEDLLKRITFDNKVLCGKPLIRGLRISVEMILELLAKNVREQAILEDYPELEPEDIRAALLMPIPLSLPKKSLKELMPDRLYEIPNRCQCKWGSCQLAY